MREQAEEEAFDAFVRDRSTALLRTAVLLAGDHAAGEDLLQTALVKTYGRWRHVRRDDAPEVYVRQVMLNVQRSWWRRLASREHVTADVGEPPASGALSPEERTALRTELLAALRRVPTRQRAAVVLRHYLDRSEAETARELGCSVGTVKSQTSRGLAALRDALPVDPRETSDAP